MSAEQNKAIIRRLYDEAISKGNLDLIDQLVDPNVVEHDELPPGLTPDREGVKQFFAMFRSAFPDLRFQIEDLLADGDRVAARVTVSGTHRGEFAGLAPTGKEIEISAIDFFRVANGKVMEHWGVEDQLGMMQQLGAIPPTA